MTHNLSPEIAELRQELSELKEAFDSLKEQFDGYYEVLHGLRGDFRMHEEVDRYRKTVGTEG